MALSINHIKKPRKLQAVNNFDLSGSELISILSMFDLFGCWKLEFESGQLSWTPDVFPIHGLEFREGPVDIATAIRVYHPEDQKIVASLISEAIENRTGFSYVLRVQLAGGQYKLIKSICKYRVNNAGKEELFGVFSEFSPSIRSITLEEFGCEPISTH